MNKVIALIMVIVMMCSIGGCARILSPEELINPPELNVEKKEVKDAVTKFLPQNSELFPFPYAKEKSESSLSLKDIDNDGSEEIVAIYRDKATFKIGILMLEKEYGIWVKKDDIKLDGIDITDYIITDINKNGVMEIVIGYESRNSAVRKLNIFNSTPDGLKQIFETDYHRLSIADIIGDESNELVIASVTVEKSDNKVSVYSNEDGSFVRKNFITYPLGTEPYNITIGQLEEGRNAIFVDLYVDKSYGEFDVLVYDKNILYSIINEDIDLINYQQIPIQSADVDKDGLIEIGNTLSSPVAKEKGYGDEGVYFLESKSTFMPLRNYYKYENKSFVKVKEYFDESALGITMDVPKILWDKYIVKFVSKDGDDVLEILYSPDRNSVGYSPLIEIRMADKSKKEELTDYQLISESENYIVVAKQIITATGLNGSEYYEYQQALEATKNIVGFISQYTL